MAWVFPLGRLPALILTANMIKLRSRLKRQACVAVNSVCLATRGWAVDVVNEPCPPPPAPEKEAFCVRRLRKVRYSEVSPRNEPTKRSRHLLCLKGLLQNRYTTNIIEMCTHGGLYSVMDMVGRM